MTRYASKSPLMLLMFVVAISGLLLAPVTHAAELNLPEIPERTVKFASMPFLDHAQGYLGVEHGWFDAVGITLDPSPHGRVITPAQRAALHAAGTVELSSGATIAAVSLHKQLPQLKFFVIADVFQGYGIMTSPDAEFDTYNEIVKSGGDNEAAIQQALAQLKGARWAVDLSPAGRAFADTVLKLAGLTREDVELVEVEAARVFELLVAGRVDFATPGAPGRVELQKRGFVPFLTQEQLLENAQGSSVAYRSVFFDGWLINGDVWEEDPDLVLRLASVAWRISRYLIDHPEQALAEYLPYLGRISGRELSVEEGKIILSDIDPFIPFEEQVAIFNDSDHILYHDRSVGAKIEAQEEQGVFAAGEVSVEDVSIAEAVWRAMNEYRTKYQDRYTAVKKRVEGLSDASARASLSEALEEAQMFFDGYDYLDAFRYLEAVEKSL